jgi:hypothetical protein
MMHRRSCLLSIPISVHFHYPNTINLITTRLQRSGAATPFQRTGARTGDYGREV